MTMPIHTTTGDGCAQWCVLDAGHDGAPCLGSPRVLALTCDDPPVVHLHQECGWQVGIRLNLGERDAGWTLTPPQARTLAGWLGELADQAEG